MFVDPFFYFVAIILICVRTSGWIFWACHWNELADSAVLLTVREAGKRMNLNTEEIIHHYKPGI